MMRVPSNLADRFIALTLLVLGLSNAHAFGQDSKGTFKDAKLVTTGENMIRPNPYDKFIALDSALGAESIKWKEVMNRTEVNVDPDTLKDTKVAIPALLGFRICDGIMAIKARDTRRIW
jgi:hypothetical protein